MKLQVKRLHPDARLPIQATPGSAGYDLTATHLERINETTWIYDIGLAIQIPYGYEGQLRARSSIFKTGCYLANGVGTLDADFTGPIRLIFIGPQQPYQVGDRIAQLIVSQVANCNFEVVEELASTSRGNGGFGSTGNGSLGYGKL